MSATADASTALDMTRSFFAAYNRHDVTSMVAACSERAELRYVPMGSYGRGKVHELGKAIWSGLIDALPDLHVAVQSMFGGASNIAAEVMIGGTQRKDLVYGQVRIRSQGKHYELPHAFLLQIDESGLIKEVAAYWDNASFYSQLGKQHWTEGSS
jgi:ketosteroid isomerase-like protein